MKPTTINDLIEHLRPGYTYIYGPDGTLRELAWTKTPTGMKLTDTSDATIPTKYDGLCINPIQATRLARCHQHTQDGAPPGTFYSPTTWRLYTSLNNRITNNHQK